MGVRRCWTDKWAYLAGLDTPMQARASEASIADLRNSADKLAAKIGNEERRLRRTPH